MEQVFMDYFSGARAYEQKQKTTQLSLRKDLELETLSEILQKNASLLAIAYVQAKLIC
ncbi:MAG: hypothetical protein IPL35_09315 [Sphingobacteriales bacterium]|nr:hypothetical protein [Sphingobacteriales bacterium]